MMACSSSSTMSSGKLMKLRISVVPGSNLGMNECGSSTPTLIGHYFQAVHNPENRLCSQEWGTFEVYANWDHPLRIDRALIRILDNIPVSKFNLCYTHDNLVLSCSSVIDPVSLKRNTNWSEQMTSGCTYFIFGAIAIYKLLLLMFSDGSEDLINFVDFWSQFVILIFCPLFNLPDEDPDCYSQ